MATIQQYLDALRAFHPSVTKVRDGLAIILGTDLDARLVSARDPDDDEYDPDVEQDIREEVVLALGDLEAEVLIDDEDGVTVIPEAPDTALRGDHALILAGFDQISCACGVYLYAGEAGEIRASSFDPHAAMPHFNRGATELDLAHECTWNRGQRSEECAR